MRHFDTHNAIKTVPRPSARRENYLPRIVHMVLELILISDSHTCPALERPTPARRSMHIASFKIANYKSFSTTAEVSLTPGFNVIVGQNNVGKTALVEALSLRFEHHPHRSLKTIPTPGFPAPGFSVANVQLTLSRQELWQTLRRLGDVWVPTPLGDAAQAARSFAEAIKNTNVLTTTWNNGSLASAQLLTLPETPGAERCALLRLVGSDSVEAAQAGLSGVNPGGRFDWRLAESLKAGHVYAFDAERLHIGACPSGTSVTLKPDASNLPEVLENLQGRNPPRFRRLTGYVHDIFPVVQDVSVRPRDGGQVEIILWTIDPVHERADLAIPLAESGTGIAQVLAMLYVTLATDNGQAVIIDEPQSFLHPGAIRKLTQILKQHPQHQFIITTHSPTAITAADPETLLRLRIEEGETIIDRLDVGEARDLRIVLADVGARLSDVFGADNVLWVEGRTEEMCFPKVAQCLTPQSLLGTAVVGVLHTAEFDARRSEATVELYNRLSAGRGLLPPAVGFIFDREGRSETMRADLARRGNVSFLARRMYENYLLHAAAIAAVASSVEGFRDPPPSEGDVTVWLAARRWDARYFDPLPADRTDATWLREVRADRVLCDLFAQLSEGRVAYDKVRHGVALTDWLLEHAPEELREVAQLMADAVAPRGAQ